MFAGILFAVTACLVWGLGFAAPLFAPEFTPAQLSAARFIVFGGFSAALCLRWRPPPLRHPLWRQAVLGSVSGNLLYYLCLVGGIRLIGVPLPTLIVGMLPVTLALAANLRGGELRWARLWPSLALIGAGLLAVNADALARLPANGLGDFALGVGLALMALAFWTWFGLMNARLLRAGALSASVWSAMLGAAVLPFALALAAWAFSLPWPQVSADAWLRLAAVALVTGVIGGWWASWLWSQASVRLPVTLAGQLIVVETLAGIAYGQLYTWQWPDWPLLLGGALMVAGVVWALSAARGGGN